MIIKRLQEKFGSRFSNLIILHCLYLVYMRKLALLFIAALSFTGCHTSKKGLSQEDQITLSRPSAAENVRQPQALPDEASAHVWDFRDATTWLLGDITLGQIRDREPHMTWYNNEYTEHSPPSILLIVESPIQFQPD